MIVFAWFQVFSVFVITIATSLVVCAQSPAPSETCAFHGARSAAPVRQITGPEPAPYYFACGVRTKGACATGSLPPGLIVSEDREKDGWACVTGGNSSSGWVQVTRLMSLPAEPKVLITSWLGWWHHGRAQSGTDNDLLLITKGSAPGSLQVSGKAFWYGAVVNGAPVEHSGQLNAEAIPIGNHVHFVQSDGHDNGCVVDLTLHEIEGTPTLSSYDNENCGGMNVRFAGDWKRFTPDKTKSSAQK